MRLVERIPDNAHLLHELAHAGEHLVCKFKDSLLVFGLLDLLPSEFYHAERRIERLLVGNEHFLLHGFAPELGFFFQGGPECGIVRDEHDYKQMKDYIVAENQQLLGGAEFAQIAAQTIQNMHDIPYQGRSALEGIAGRVHAFATEVNAFYETVDSEEQLKACTNKIYLSRGFDIGHPRADNVLAGAIPPQQR